MHRLTGDRTISLHEQISSVEVLSTAQLVTQAWHFHVFDWELIIVSQLVSLRDTAKCENDNVPASVYNNLSRVAVRFA